MVIDKVTEQNKKSFSNVFENFFYNSIKKQMNKNKNILKLKMLGMKMNTNQIETRMMKVKQKKIPVKQKKIPLKQNINVMCARRQFKETSYHS